MLRLGGIALSALCDYVKAEQTNNSDTPPEEEGNDKLKANHMRLSSIRGTLEKYGGVFSKISQILSYSDHAHSTVYDKCEPIYRDSTHEWFVKYLDEKSSNTIPYVVDLKIHKSGSVGQVYKAHYKDEVIALKILYRGLRESTDNDLKSLKTLSLFMFGFAELSDGIKEIGLKMKDEMDYHLEVENTNRLHDIWKGDPDVVIPRAISCISDENIIATTFIEGVSLSTYLESATQEEKNRVGSIIVRFVFTNLYKFGIFYSDSHYGNIIITPENKVAFIDFGCLNIIDEKIRVKLVNLHRAALSQDESLMVKCLDDLGIIDTGNTSKKSVDYCVSFFKIQYKPWIHTTPTFRFGNEFYDCINSKKPTLMKEWVLPKGMIYLNKIPHGLVLMLCKMNCEYNFSQSVFGVDILGELCKT